MSVLIAVVSLLTLVELIGIRVWNR
jgi:hypothetical protein